MPSPPPYLMEICFACQAFLGSFLPLSYHYARLPPHLDFGAPGKLGEVQYMLSLQRPVQGLARSRCSIDMPPYQKDSGSERARSFPRVAHSWLTVGWDSKPHSRQPDQEGNWAGGRTTPGVAAFLPLPRFNFQDSPPWRLVEGTEGRRELARRERRLRSLFHEGRGPKSLTDPRDSNKEQKGEACCLAALPPPHTRWGSQLPSLLP